VPVASSSPIFSAMLLPMPGMVASAFAPPLAKSVAHALLGGVDRLARLLVGPRLERLVLHGKEERDLAEQGGDVGVGRRGAHVGCAAR
jgi:hypothetical protein